MNTTGHFGRSRLRPRRHTSISAMGDDWVERMGGEEKFVQLIRRKLREMRRRLPPTATGTWLTASSGASSRKK